MMYDAIVIDNFGGIVCRKDNIDWMAAISWCFCTAETLGIGYLTDNVDFKYSLLESGIVKVCHEVIAEIRIDKHI